MARGVQVTYFLDSPLGDIEADAKRRWVHRLTNEVVGSGRQHIVESACFLTGGHDEDERGAALRIERVDLSAHFKAVDAREQQIEQNEVGNAVLEALQSLLARGARDDTVAAGPEDLGEEPTVGLIVLDEQNAQGALLRG